MNDTWQKFLSGHWTDKRPIVPGTYVVAFSREWSLPGDPRDEELIVGALNLERMEYLTWKGKRVPHPYWWFGNGGRANPGDVMFYWSEPLPLPASIPEYVPGDCEDPRPSMMKATMDECKRLREENERLWRIIMETDSAPYGPYLKNPYGTEE